MVSPPAEEPTRFLLGDWCVDVEEGTLRHGGESRRLEPRVLAVLRALVRRRGRLVERETLLAEVWSDVHVHEIALTRCISELRKALGDDPRAPRYIETLPKRGYRLVATVRPALRGSAPPVASPRRVGSLRFRVAAAMLAAAAVAVAIAGLSAAGDDAAPTIRALRASSPAAELYERGVAFYERRRYRDNENALALLSAALDRDPSLHAARAALANALATKARYESYDPELIDRAIRVAMEATARAPKLPEAHKALGLALSAGGSLSRATAAYSRALALRPEYGAARTNLAAVLWHRGRRDEALRHALAGRPGDDAVSAANLAAMLDGLGLPGDADRWYARALELEPHREATVVDLALRDAVAERFERARARLAALEAVVPDCEPCLLARAEIEYRAGDPQRASHAARTYFERRPDWRPAQLYMVLALRVVDPERATELLARAERQARAYEAGGTESWWAPWSLAVIAAQRGDRDEALDWFAMAIDDGLLDWRQQRYHPLLEPLHADPGFERLIERMRARVAEQRRRFVGAGQLEVLRTATP